jgi:peptide/nickel transport system permease protein
MSKTQLAILKYAIKRIVMIIPLLFLITVLVFIMLKFAPGDPAVLMLGPEATVEKIEQVRVELGLNKPLYIQVWDFIMKLILHGDLGRSYQSGRPVIDEIARTLPISTQLALNGILISTFIAVFIGVLSAVKQYSLLDNVVKIVVLTGVSMPVFWLGLVMIVIFSVYFGILPSAGWGDWQHMILPSLTIAVYPLAIITRLTRSSMLEVIQQNYIRTARSKGLSENAVIYQHALRNAFIPIITVIGIQFGVLISSAVLTETVFAIPGMGRLIVESIFNRDYAIIRGVILVTALIFIIINLIVDLSYSFFDPRIKY